MLNTKLVTPELFVITNFECNYRLLFLNIEKSHPGVNLANIKRANFTYECAFVHYSVQQKFSHSILPA